MLRVVARVKHSAWNVPPEIRVQSWTRMGRREDLYHRCKRYIETELGKALRYQEERAILPRMYDHKQMDFRIIKTERNANTGEITINEVQPDMHTFTSTARFSYSRRHSRHHSRYKEGRPSDSDVLTNLGVLFRARRSTSGSIAIKLHSWTGKGKNVIVDRTCKRYIRTEMRKAVFYQERYGKRMRGVTGAILMDFRVINVDYNENMGLITVREVQPDIHSFTSRATSR
jgi:hypothetical protein